MKQIQINIQRAFLKAFDLSFHLVSNLNLVSSIYNGVSVWSLTHNHSHFQDKYIRRKK